MAAATDFFLANGGRAHTPGNPLIIGAAMRFMSALAAIPSIQRVAFETDNDQFALWILLRAGSRPDEERIFLLERDFRAAIRAEMMPIDIHVFALDEVKESALPPTTIIFER